MDEDVNVDEKIKVDKNVKIDDKIQIVKMSKLTNLSTFIKTSTSPTTSQWLISVPQVCWTKKKFYETERIPKKSEMKRTRIITSNNFSSSEDGLKM